MKFVSLAVVVGVVGVSLGLAGCKRKANPTNVEAAIMTSIFQDRKFFDEICGFPLDIMYQASTQVDVTDIDAQQSFFGSDGDPGTATIHLTKVHKKKGVSEELKCDAKVSFVWGPKSKPVTKGVHRVGDRHEWFEAWNFKKL